MPVISKDSFQFLQQIALNNNKPWFEKNRARYEKARSEWIAVVGKVAEGILKIEAIPEKEPAKYVHRIYRDIRFSKDKTPYKKFFSAIIERGPEAQEMPSVPAIPTRQIHDGGWHLGSTSGYIEKNQAGNRLQCHRFKENHSFKGIFEIFWKNIRR